MGMESTHEGHRSGASSIASSWTKLERPAADEHSSLLGPLVNYGRFIILAQVSVQTIFLSLVKMSKL